MTNPSPVGFAPFDAAAAKLRVLLVTKAGLSAVGRSLDEAASGAITRAMEIASFKGEAKTVLDIVLPAGAPADRVLVMGLGDATAFGAGWVDLGGRLRAKLGGVKTDSAELLLDAEGLQPGGQEASDVALGYALRSYAFRKYKRKKAEAESEEETPNAPALRVLLQDVAAAQTAHARGGALAEGVALARELVNEPANILGPEEFAARVSELTSSGLEIEVLDKAALEAGGFGALLAVGQGSARPSQIVLMRWNGGTPGEAPIALIGKGVTFDTGGISIKPSGGMEEMKGDMGGAAAVVGAMLTLAKRHAKANVIGAIGLTENMPSGTAMRPGDIITSLSGQTIEVLNTDAEGRLVLADVMWHVGQVANPRAMVTLATLTGAIIVALGREHAGLFANDDALAQQVTDAGLATDEKVWRLPLTAKYDKLIDSRIADMKNIGDRGAGSITAAQFLQRFVKAGTPWAHLDVAGTAMASPPSDINASWGSGYGVRLLDELVAKFYEQTNS